MAHSRVVHKEIWRSSRFLSVKDHGAQLLYCAMLNEADDFGNMEADSSQLWRWARDFLNLDSEKQIEPWLVKLSRVDLIALYQAHGKRYLHIQRWKNSRNYIANPTIPLSPWNDPQPRTGRGRLAAHAKIEQGQPLPQPDGNLAATLPAINGNGIDHETGEILNGNGSNCRSSSAA